MDSNDDKNLIKVTHYVNPHMFWFKYESSFFTDDKFFDLCTKIEKYYLQQEKSTRQRLYKPQIGEVVGVYKYSYNRWIRAKIDYVFELQSSTSLKYIVWAIDYGIPLQIEERFIRKLPSDLAEIKIDTIHFGGIANIIPAEKVYDFMTNTTEIVSCNKWSPYSVNIIEQLINDAAYIRFTELKRNPINDQIFGNLEIITHTNQIIKPEIGLLESNHAIHVKMDDKYFNILKKIGTNTLPRWQTYGGALNVYKQNTNNLINIDDNYKIINERKQQQLKTNKGKNFQEDLNEIEDKVNEWQQRNQKSCYDEILISSETDDQYEGINTMKKFQNGENSKSLKCDDDENNISLSTDIKKLCDDIDKSKIDKDVNHKEQQENELEEEENKLFGGELNICGSTRIGRMKIYKNHAPPPPSTSSSSLSVQRFNIKRTNINYVSLKSETNSISSKENDDDLKSKESQSIDEKNSSITEDDDVAIMTMKQNESEKPVIKNRINAIENKRKLFLKKTLNTQRVENLNTESSKSVDIIDNLSLCSETTKTSTNSEISNDNEKQMNKFKNEGKITENILNDNKEIKKNIIPAGYDLMNLQPKKKSIQDKMNTTKNNRKLYLTKRLSINNNDSSILQSNNVTDQLQKNVFPAGIDLMNIHTTTKPQQQKGNDNETLDNVKKFISDAAANTRNFKRNYSTDHKKIESSRRNLQDHGEVCVIDKNLKKHLVLVHGRKAKPIEKVENANFCEDVHQELENMRLTHVYRIQSYTWPHLMRGNSVIVVNSARTGKTMSYLPAICSLIKMKKDEEVIPEGEGPIGIIIAPTSLDVEKISRICWRFFQNSSNQFSIVESYGIRKTEKATIYLLNGCDILVTTPSSLARLLNNKIKLFDSKRLRHLVIDNIDLIHDKVQSDLNLILKKIYSFNKKDKTPIQVAITARLWHSYIYKLIKLCNNPQLCIGAYIEAAFYGRSQIKMKFIEKKSKIQAILDFLKKHPYTTERLIVLCNSDQDLEEVVEALKSLSIVVTYVSSKSSAEEIQIAFEMHRRQTDYLDILVCTDAVLFESKVQNAQNLIHYSLPDSWSKFAFRFSVFFEYYEDFLKTDQMNKPAAISLILLDETNNTQLPKLIEFLQIHGYGSDISNEILALSNQINIQREEKRVQENREFCSQLLSYGTCNNQNDCPYRHILTKYDAPEQNIPTEGAIIVKVLNVISPVHYCVRILEQQLNNGQIIKNSNESNNYVKFFMEFSQYFNNTNNHETHWPIKINDLCVVKYLDNYYRAKVLEVLSKYSNNILFNVRVKLVDIGQVITCKSTTILVLPEDLKKLPFQAVNIRVSGIVPYDFEHNWDSEATSTVQYWINNYDQENKNDVVLKANILFSLIDTVWVDKIVIQEKLKSISCSIYGVNIKKELVRKNYAINYDVVTDIIREMAHKCGILKIENGDIKNEKFKENTDNFKNENGKSIIKENEHNTDDDHTVKSILDESHTSELSFLSKSSDFNKSIERANTRKRRSRINKDNNKREKDQTKLKKNLKLGKKINERWELINDNDYTRIVVTAFYTPNQFYVQNVENFNKLEELYKLIDHHIDFETKQKLIEPKIGLNCLAKLDNKYNRAKITKVLCSADGLQVNLFFCDSGMSETQSLDDIYHSTEEIITFIPFQAIRCKLTGVQSTSNGIWTSEVCDLMYYGIIEISEYLYIRPIKTDEPKLEDDLRYWTYEVIMIDCTTDEDIKINHRIVEEGLAIYDPDTEHFLDMVFNNHIYLNQNADNCSSYDEDEEENWDNINLPSIVPEKKSKDNKDEPLLDLDIQFTEEQALELLNSIANSNFLPSTIIDDLRNKKVEKNNDEIVQKVEKNFIQCSENVVSQAENEQEENVSRNQKDCEDRIPQLKNLNQKIPNVVWQQSASLICLSISAPDIDNYSLKINSESLLFIGYCNNEKSIVQINFLGIICPNLTSHEIRGLNVVIRLVKTVKGMQWPRLTWESDKCTWLKYNYNTIVIENEQYTNTDHKITDQMYENIYYSSTDEDDDECVLDVERENDVYDPLEDF